MHTVCMLSHFSCVRFFANPWTIAHQAPLSMGFSRQEYYSGLPCPPPGDLADPGIEPASPVTPALQADSLLLSHRGSSKYVLLSERSQYEKPIYCMIPDLYDILKRQNEKKRGEKK